MLSISNISLTNHSLTWTSTTDHPHILSFDRKGIYFVNWKMGLLTEGQSLSPEKTLALSEYVREHGVTQFLVTWNRVKDIQGSYSLTAAFSILSLLYSNDQQSLLFIQCRSYILNFIIHHCIDILDIGSSCSTYYP